MTITSLFLALSFPVLAVALEPELKMVPLHNGLNAVDLNSDGRDDLVVVARRENFNAHGVEATTIYLWEKGAGASGGALQMVPIRPVVTEEHRSWSDDLVFLSGGGADARLTDFRLFTDPAHHTAVMIVAERKFGESFADVQPVVFEYFRLTRNDDGLPGDPLYYFKSYKKETSKKPHQDVNEAFNSELGLKPDGRQTLPESTGQ